ncbi:MAG: hypothetical protein CMB80_01770 [Flammeovirgaceae bacterium]|nr:hypothetical protein [Flammeovirgaceae bacterium]|tara:strand:+ start:240 stop:626 length:387 start_codon:yes stop_codon:yes gene_type:complete
MADYHFNKAMRHKYHGRIDEHIEECRKAVRFNPYVLNYRNVLALTYLQTAIKAAKANLHRDEIVKWFTKAIYTAETVQQYYPGEYHSAAMLRDAYLSLDQLSSKDVSNYIEKYNNIVIKARPYEEGAK